MQREPIIAVEYPCAMGFRVCDRDVLQKPATVNFLSVVLFKRANENMDLFELRNLFKLS